MPIKWHGLYIYNSVHSIRIGCVSVFAITNCIMNQFQIGIVHYKNLILRSPVRMFAMTHAYRTNESLCCFWRVFFCSLFLHYSFVSYISFHFIKSFRVSIEMPCNFLSIFSPIFFITFLLISIFHKNKWQLYGPHSFISLIIFHCHRCHRSELGRHCDSRWFLSLKQATK